MNKNNVFPTTQENYTSQKGTFNPAYESSGLTKRELFAAMAMQSIINQCGKHEAITTALYAVQHADALIAELNKEEK